MKKELIYQFSHLYNEAQVENMRKRSCADPLDSIPVEDYLFKIMEDFISLLDSNGFYIQKKPEAIEGGLDY